MANHALKRPHTMLVMLKEVGRKHHIEFAPERDFVQRSHVIDAWARNEIGADEFSDLPKMISHTTGECAKLEHICSIKVCRKHASDGREIGGHCGLPKTCWQAVLARNTAVDAKSPIVEIDAVPMRYSLEFLMGIDAQRLQIAIERPRHHVDFSSMAHLHSVDNS